MKKLSILLISCVLLLVGIISARTSEDANIQPQQQVVTTEQTEEQSSIFTTTIQPSVSGFDVSIREYGDLNPNNRVVLYMHGAGGRETAIVEAASTEATIVSPTYPLSELELDDPDDSFIYETLDVGIQHIRDAGYEDQDIQVVGFSLGSGPALYAAANYPDLDSVIIIGGFANVGDVCVQISPQLCTLVPSDFLDSTSLAQMSMAPIYQYHGLQDELVGFEFGEELHQLISGPKEFTQYEGGHSDFDIAEILRERPL